MAFYPAPQRLINSGAHYHAVTFSEKLIEVLFRILFFITVPWFTPQIDAPVGILLFN